MMMCFGELTVLQCSAAECDQRGLACDNITAIRRESVISSPEAGRVGEAMRMLILLHRKVQLREVMAVSSNHRAITGSHLKAIKSLRDGTVTE